jgi:hypothetical protein
VTLALAWLAPAVYAGDTTPPTLERPAAATAAAPTVVLGRPVPVGATGAAQSTGQSFIDRQVRPIAFETPGSAAPASRGADPIISRPLPIGPPPVNPNAVVPTWRKYGDAEPSPEIAPMPSTVTPGPAVDDGGSFLSRIFHAWWHDWCDDCATGPTCGPDCCSQCGGCRGERWYISAEYLMWWFKGQAVPPLITSGSMGDAIPGALNFPATTILFGGRHMENGEHSGGRFMIGSWLCDDYCLGWEAGYFFLGPGVTNFRASSPGSPILTRPFINAATGTESAELVAGPGVLAGTVTVQTRSSLWGAEANLRSNVWTGCHSFLDVLAGFRTLGLDEDLIIHENLRVLLPPGGTFDLVDHFRTENRFYGGQVGAEWQCRVRRWDLGIKAKLAIGETQQFVTISGIDVVTDPINGTRSFNSGLLTQQSNIGHYSRDRFTYVPEVGFTVGYHLTEHLRCFAGYNFIYWSSVARPGPQIDRTVNVNQIAPPIPGGPARPAFTFNGTDFWAQGFNVGLEYKW